MTEKLSMEERAQREREAQFADEALQEVAQFARLREAFPDLTDAEIAHRMAAEVKQAKKLKKLLEK